MTQPVRTGRMRLALWIRATIKRSRCFFTAPSFGSGIACQPHDAGTRAPAPLHEERRRLAAGRDPVRDPRPGQS